jgi:diaminopropionate ammonia-lyase
MPRAILNPLVRPELRTEQPTGRALAAHRRLPGYRPTPLRELPELARRTGVASVHLKDESQRFGLPAYKVLGASWATLRLLERMAGHSLEPWDTLDDLRRGLAPLGPLKLITATDGNHGRGVARVAGWLGFAAEIFVPEGTRAARIEGIAREGARVTVVAGTYDDTVARAAESRGPDTLLVSDHGWPGYEEIPTWVAEGYQTLFQEIEAQLMEQGAPEPDLLLVQIGVGTLAGAMVARYRGTHARPLIVGVEPTGAACALLSVEAGAPVMIHAGADASIMAGLNCGTPSTAAWPLLRDGVDAYVAVEDEQARQAMRHLASEGVVSGESGAASAAGLVELMTGKGSEPVRDAMGIGPRSRVLLISTEGATDPVSYRSIVGRDP